MTDQQTAFRIFAGDIDMGTFWGASEDEALDAYAQDAGFEDYEALRAEHGPVDEIREATDEEVAAPTSSY